MESKQVEKELKKGNSIFIVRAIIFLMLLLAPAIFVFFKYECWNITSKMSLSGYAILGIILFGIGLYAFFRYLVFGGKWAYWKQVVKGVIKVLIPFIVVIGLIYVSIDFLKELLIMLIFGGLCFFSAYLVNPFPERAYKRSLGETADVVEYAIKRSKEK